MNLHEHEVWVAMNDGVVLQGLLAVPDGARGVVVFAQSGGGERQGHNHSLAALLAGAGLATLLVELLTEEEEDDPTRGPRLRADVDLLAHRLVTTSRWLPQLQLTRGLGIGYFGSGTAAAAALIAAGREPHRIGAVVTRAGRLDLLDEEQLSSVWAPTLLLAPRHDPKVLQDHRNAYDRMATEKHLEVVAISDAAFENAGSLEYQGRLARDWFIRHLAIAEQPWGGTAWAG